MDNFYVGASFVAGLILTQIPELPYNDFTALGLVAFTVIFFLCKYNGQMQELREQNKLIMQRQEIDNENHNKALENHNKALERIADGLKELLDAIMHMKEKDDEK